MENSIFRKSSLERIQNPEELNQYITDVKPMSWLLLIGFLVILAGVFDWALNGVIPERVIVSGITHSMEGHVPDVYLFVPYSVSMQLAVGMEAQVSPDYAPREEYGFAYGSIKRIGERPVVRQTLFDLFGEHSIIESLLPDGNFILVEIAIEKAGGAPVWSNPKGEAMGIQQGAYCEIRIITDEHRPIDMVFKL